MQWHLSSRKGSALGSRELSCLMPSWVAGTTGGMAHCQNFLFLVWDWVSPKLAELVKNSWPQVIIPALSEAQSAGITWGQEFKAAWPTWWKPISNNNKKKLARVLAYTPVMPATCLGGWGRRITWTWEVEVENWDEIQCPFHSEWATQEWNLENV